MTYSYYTQDHLGNNCAVVNEDGTLEQITHYYPFGDVYGDASLNVSSQTYKYNGKELDRMYILDRYDYGARSYDAVVPINTNKTSTNIKYTIDKKGKHGVWVAWKNGKAQFFYYDSMKPGTTNFNYDNNKKYNYEKNK